MRVPVACVDISMTKRASSSMQHGITATGAYSSVNVARLRSGRDIMGESSSRSIRVRVGAKTAELSEFELVPTARTIKDTRSATCRLTTRRNDNNPPRSTCIKCRVSFKLPAKRFPGMS